MGSLFSSVGLHNLDISHKINHISFGDEADIKTIKKYDLFTFKILNRIKSRKFNAGVLDPLDNFDFLVPEHDKQRGMMQQYYLNVY